MKDDNKYFIYHKDHNNVKMYFSRLDLRKNPNQFKFEKEKTVICRAIFSPELGIGLEKDKAICIISFINENENLDLELEKAEI